MVMSVAGTSKMKIMLIGTTAACLLNFRSDLINTLIEEGYSVHALAIDYSDSTRDQVRALGAIPVDYTFSRSGLNPFVDICNTLKLARIIKAFAPDVVFSYFAKPVVFGTIAAKWAGVSKRIGMLEGLGYAFTVHPGKPSLKKAFIRYVQVFLYWLAFRFLDRLIFLNTDDPKDLLRAYNLKVDNVSVLGGIGLDLADYPYMVPPVSPISFIFVGRLLAEKGVHEFVAAARLIKLEYPDVKFYMLGGLDEDNPGGLSRLELTELTHKGLITHPGHVDNVVHWLKSSSVFVLPSYREGFPRSTQEAMAVGRAVITTDVPGCRDTVVDGVNGFLVPPCSVPDLVEKMRYFIERPEHIVSMGRKSYAIAQKNFHSRKVNARLMRYFN